MANRNVELGGIGKWSVSDDGGSVELRLEGWDRERAYVNMTADEARTLARVLSAAAEMVQR